MIMSTARELPNDLSTAHQVILTMSEMLTQHREELAAMKHALTELERECHALKSGKRREKFINPDQRLLPFGDQAAVLAQLETARKAAEAEVQRITYDRKKQPKDHKKPANTFPACLPREVIEVAIPQAYQLRIDSGELIVKRYEISEALKTIPAKLVVLQYKKPVLAYAANLEGELPVDGEANLGEKGRYHPSTGAAVVYGKFAQHLPFYRLQDMFAAAGWTPTRSTLEYLTSLVEDATSDILAIMRQRLLKAYCIGVDDTGVKLIMPKEMPKLTAGTQDLRQQRLVEKMQEAYDQDKGSINAKMWGYTSFDATAPYDMFDFRVSRHRDGPEEFLAGYAGHVMADCYSGNMSVILAPGSKMIRLACWAHARRHIYENQSHDPVAAAYPLALMQQLYDIERRTSQWSTDARKDLRNKESRPILDRLKAWLDGPIPDSILPASKLSGAFNYLRNHWEALCEFARDGQLPIDNNQCERLMRLLATGRKNWLFMGSVKAAQRNANLMSLVASAHRQDLDIAAYLESVITHQLRGTAAAADCLPDVWKTHHPEAVRTYRVEERRYKADTAKLRSAKRKCESRSKQQAEA